LRSTRVWLRAILSISQTMTLKIPDSLTWGTKY
jgi:hypothetical protein